MIPANLRQRASGWATLLVAAALVGCGTPQKPPEMEAFERLRADHRTAAAVQVAPDIMRRADRAMVQARDRWENNDLEDAVQASLVGQARVYHAIALAEQADAERRAKKAARDKDVASEEAERLERDLAALQEQIALLERLNKTGAEQERLQAELAKQQQQATDEQQKLAQQLQTEKARAGVAEKLKAAELALKEAETVNAARYAAAPFGAASDMLARAKKELEGNQLEAARLSADLARQKAAVAIEEARPQFQQDAQAAERKTRAEAMASDAAGIRMVEVRRESRGSLQQLVLHMPGSVLFGKKAANTILSPDGGAVVDQVARLLQKYPDYPVQVIGHCERRGSQDALLARSLARAQSVFSALVSRGADARRMVVTGKGGDEPVSDNRSAAGRERNNRVELVFMYQ